METKPITKKEDLCNHVPGIDYNFLARRILLLLRVTEKLYAKNQELKTENRELRAQLRRIGKHKINEVSLS